MSWHEPPDNDFDVQINHDEDYPQPRRKIGTFLRNNRIALFILVNMISLSILIFFASGGRPLERLLAVKNNTASLSQSQKSEAELQAEDYVAVKMLVSQVKGYDANFMLHQYDQLTFDYMKKTYPIFGNSRGNVFAQVGGSYVYLSKDGKRLYICSFPDDERFNTAGNPPAPARRRQPNQIRKTDSITVYSPSPVSGEPLKEKELSRGEFYQDKDGVWRNY